MSLSGYPGKAAQIGEELRAMLRAEEFEPWLSDAATRGQQTLRELRAADPVLIERIATAEPAARRKMLERLPPDRRFWAIAAAAQLAFEASAVLSAVQSELVPGMSHRWAIGAAQTVLSAPYLSEDALWPFPFPPARL